MQRHANGHKNGPQNGQHDGQTDGQTDGLNRRRPGVVGGLLLAGYQTAAFYVILLAFWAGTLAWTLCASVLVWFLPVRRGAVIGQYVTMLSFRGFVGAMCASGIVKCDLTALDALRAEGGIVIAPNHPSLLDAVLVISRLPRVVCITKASLWDNPFLGGSVRLSRYIRNDSPLVLVREAARQIKAGRQLLIFPEGTRTIRPPVNDFKGGFALMAKLAGAPVQTVFIETNSLYLSKGWPLFRKPPLPLVYRARLGRRFEVEGNVGEFVTRLEAYFRAELADKPA